MKFHALINEQLYARALHLNKAMMEFAKFTDLAESASETAAWLKIGFSALCAIQPGFSTETVVRAGKGGGCPGAAGPGS